MCVYVGVCMCMREIVFGMKNKLRSPNIIQALCHRGAGPLCILLRSYLYNTPKFQCFLKIIWTSSYISMLKVSKAVQVDAFYKSLVVGITEISSVIYDFN